MQDRYVGDVGDFGKYGLLNEIYEKSNESIKLGINWYYVTGQEKQTEDGRHIDYLRDENKNSKKYHDCFPNLYSQLKSIVNYRSRNIKAIEKGLILPTTTIFYSEPLPYPSVKPIERRKDRENWFEKSLITLKTSDIVFLDPDNGIQTDKIKKTQIRAIKYVFADEVKQYYELGKSLIIYTHRDRNPESEYRKKILAVRDSIRTQNETMVLRFKRVSVRHYVFLIQKEHQDLIEETINCLIRDPYNFLFEIYNLD